MASPDQAPEVPPSSEIRFRASCRTRWSDEDNQGVLNNAVYLTLLEEARFQYFEHLGQIGRHKHFTFVLGQTTIRYLAPGHGPAEVQVEIVTVDLGTRSFRQAYRVLDAASGKVWAEAIADLVIWNSQSQSSAPMPDTFRAAMADFEGI
ncbi:MAG: acyl-CoA thioesterase [Planctomycetota bacterium]|jgi:acyl-CoA thioester hydrolase